MNSRTLGADLNVSAIGLGCMGFSHAYGPPAEDGEAIQAIRTAFDMGYTMFDTAETYGTAEDPHHNEKLVGEALKDVRSQVQIVTKFGIRFDKTSKAVNKPLIPDARPETIRASVEGSLRRLQTDHIDLYFQHRVDPKVEPEAVAQVMADLIREGKITHWGISEVSEDYLRRAHRVCPVTAVQNRYSMMARWYESLFPVLEELNVGFVAFSPMANGLLTGAYGKGEQFDPKLDYRSAMPQFTKEAAKKNQELYLSREDDPSTIPTGDFDREGRTYTLLDILKNDQTETDTKEHIEVITRDMDTKDMAEIIQLLEPELEITTEDGYTGVLVPDYTSIQVEAAGYKTSSRTVSTTRTYPNLSNADVSLIPKTVEDGGRTLTLADVQWQEAATDQMDGYDLAIHYNATATYTGTATSKYATGYTVTADYKGEITRTDCDTVIYTAIFASHGGTQNVESTEAGTEAESKAGFDARLVLIPLGAVFLGGAGYGGWRLMKYLRDKKRGYVK